MNKEYSAKVLYFIFLIDGFIFLKSGYGKLMEGKFAGALAGTLGKSVDNNPYPIVKDFINSIAIPNAVLFATLTMWGEFLSGLSIVIASLYLWFVPAPIKAGYLVLLAGSFVGMFLNAVFWLSLGWTSASTDGLNMIMFVIELSGVFFASKRLYEYS